MGLRESTFGAFRGCLWHPRAVNGDGAPDGHKLCNTIFVFVADTVALSGWLCYN